MTVSTFYSAVGTGGDSVDGTVGRLNVDETFSNIRGGAGTFVTESSTVIWGAMIRASTTTNQFDRMVRSIFTFPTSSLPDDDVIDSAVFSIIDFGDSSGLGSNEIGIVASTPASDNALVVADYSQLGTTDFATRISNASWTGQTYKDFTLNASGLANISKTGVSKFGTRLGWDIDNSFGGIWASGATTTFDTKFADTTGTASDPKLVVTHSEPPSGPANLSKYMNIAKANISKIDSVAIANISKVNSVE